MDLQKLRQRIFIAVLVLGNGASIDFSKKPEKPQPPSASSEIKI